MTDSEIIAMIRRGELAPLTAETLPASIARQEKINARLQAAIAHSFVELQVQLPVIRRVCTVILREERWITGSNNGFDQGDRRCRCRCFTPSRGPHLPDRAGQRGQADQGRQADSPILHSSRNRARVADRGLGDRSKADARN